jgi:hypothetical protein
MEPVCQFAAGGKMAEPSSIKALSVRQPWAWLIVQGYKDIENRTWSTPYRDHCLIHAGKRFDRQGYEWVRRNFRRIPMPAPGEFERGGIVGWAEITDCVTRSRSKWFSGPYGFVIGEAGELPFLPMQGRLKFFEIPAPIFLRVEVEPSVLLTSSGKKAEVQVTALDPHGKPLAGMALKSQISPAGLGKVSALPKTDRKGVSLGAWQAGKKGGSGLLVVSAEKGHGQAEIELQTPVVGVTVVPPIMIAGSGASADVRVYLEDEQGNPLEGIAISGKTDPYLGRVTRLPDTNSKGMSAGLWRAGSKPGKGLLRVTVKDGGQLGGAVIELIKLSKGGKTKSKPKPKKTKKSKPTKSSKAEKKPRKPKPSRTPKPGRPPKSGFDDIFSDIVKDIIQDFLEGLGEKNPHVGTGRRTPPGSSGGRGGGSGPGDKGSGPGG